MINENTKLAGNITSLTETNKGLGNVRENLSKTISDLSNENNSLKNKIASLENINKNNINVINSVVSKIKEDKQGIGNLYEHYKFMAKDLYTNFTNNFQDSFTKLLSPIKEKGYIIEDEKNPLFIDRPLIKELIQNNIIIELTVKKEKLLILSDLGYCLLIYHWDLIVEDSRIKAHSL